MSRLPLLLTSFKTEASTTPADALRRMSARRSIWPVSMLRDQNPACGNRSVHALQAATRADGKVPPGERRDT